MSAVIEKLKAGTEGSRELDAEIGTIIHGAGNVRVGGAGWPDDALIVPSPLSAGWSILPAYSQSIDAAKLLVPNNARRRMMINEDGRASCQIWPIIGAIPKPWGQLYASEPIAICIAALEAQELIW